MDTLQIMHDVLAHLNHEMFSTDEDRTMFKLKHGGLPLLVHHEVQLQRRIEAEKRDVSDACHQVIRDKGDYRQIRIQYRGMPGESTEAILRLCWENLIKLNGKCFDCCLVPTKNFVILPAFLHRGMLFMRLLTGNIKYEVAVEIDYVVVDRPEQTL